MSWIRKEKQSWIHSTMTSILQNGPIPRHVAFIMDGNRRFARKNNYERSKGHILGFEKLAETLEWCLDIGIMEVTLFAFSIENFKRSTEEVEGLMELAREKFARLMQEKDMIMKHGVCFRVLGNIRLLPADIQQMIAECVTLTKHNKRAIVNVCFSYTSRDEMCYAAQQISEGLSQGLLRESDISESLFEKCLYSHLSAPPDLLIRTSGEVRFSDFLLWQTCYSPYSFMPVLWPEFSRWHLYAALFLYQRQYPSILKVRQENKEAEEEAEFDRLDHESSEKSINSAESSRSSDVTSALLSSSRLPAPSVCNIGPSGDVGARDIERCREERNKRREKFLEHLQEKENAFLENLLSSKELCNVNSGNVEQFCDITFPEKI